MVSIRGWGSKLIRLHLASFSEFDPSDDDEYNESVDRDSDIIDKNM